MLPTRREVRGRASVSVRGGTCSSKVESCPDPTQRIECRRPRTTLAKRVWPGCGSLIIAPGKCMGDQRERGDIVNRSQSDPLRSTRVAHQHKKYLATVEQ